MRAMPREQRLFLGQPNALLGAMRAHNRRLGLAQIGIFRPDVADPGEG
jgi:hypothetical protein